MTFEVVFYHIYLLFRFAIPFFVAIILFNLGTEPYVVRVGDRIAQGMFVKYLEADNGNTDTERVGGFGSSGK